MPVLKNAKHERFAQALAAGKTATDAYTEAGYKPDDGNASKLAAKPDVQARVQEITGKGAIRAECTVASIIAELEEARALALAVMSPGPMVSASMGKAKIAGLLVERTEHTGKDGGPIEVELTDLEAARRIAFLLTKAAQQTPSD